MKEWGSLAKSAANKCEGRTKERQKTGDRMESRTSNFFVIDEPGTYVRPRSSNNLEHRVRRIMPL